MMKKIRKPVSVLLATIMVVSLFSIVPFAVSAATENLGGYNFTVETDAEGSYCKIDCADALSALAAYVNAHEDNTCEGMRFKQTADIDMAGRSWEPIGKDDTLRYFKGTYDGDGYFILNITHTAPGQYDISGLFGDFRGTVKNVNLKDCRFTGNCAAGIAASTYNDPSIENCSVLGGTLTGTDLEPNVGNGSCIGGIAAYFYNGSVSDCFVDTTYAGNAYDKGPVVGRTWGTLSDSCYTNVPDGATNDCGTPVAGGFITLDDGITMSGSVRTFGRTEEHTYRFAEQGEEITLGCEDVPSGYKVIWVSDDVTITDGVFTMPDHDVSVTAVFAIDSDHFSQDDANTYTIHDAEGWDIFCDALKKTDTYNRFSGKTVRLDADIAIDTMAGAKDCDFCGTFDGGEHTLTFNYGSSGNYSAEPYIAPFSYVSNTKANPGDAEDSPAAIQNLHVDGDIYTSNKYAAGIVGQHWGNLNIENCRSSVNIHSSVSGDGSHGGFEAVNNGALEITGCVFDGKLLSDSGTNKCGGFIGWRSKTATIYNSIFDPAQVTIGTDGSATFGRNYVDTFNCYYTNAFFNSSGDPHYEPYDPHDADHPDKYNNGKQTQTISAGQDVTLALSGDKTEYSVSGITAYKDNSGLLYGDKIFAGDGEEVSLTLDHTSLAGRTFLGYTADKGSLSGTQNPYTLTMPNDDVTVSAEFDEVAFNIDIPGTSHGSVTASVDGEATTTAHHNDTVTLTITPDTGYMISEVLVNMEELYPEDGVYSFKMPARGVQVLVYFDPVNYRVDIDEMTHGTVTANGTAHYNDNITLNVTPDEGYSVKYIKYNDTYLLPQTGPYTFTMPPEDVTITAEFDIPKDDPVSYLDENGEQQSVSVYDVLNGDEIELETGWYVLDDDIDWNSRVNVRGDVFLILGDDCTFSAHRGGVDVPQGYSLTIYAQSDSDSMGALTASAANGDPSAAGIGGINMSAGTITINGGNIYAKGGQHSAGIGGGKGGSGGTITINGGTVNACGNSAEDIHDQGGAGIGGGTQGSAGNITINGGIVYAEGDGYVSGIGAGKGGSGGSITINGGQVDAIGGPSQSGGIYAQGGTITLGYTEAMDHIYASSYKGTVKVADGKKLTDGTNIYDSTTSSDILAALTNSTLTPADTHDVTIGDCTNGTVTAPEKAFKGERVTVSAEADAGCKLINVRYNDTPIRPENGVYTFTMPDEDVVITATFLAPQHPVIYLDENDMTQTAVYYEVLSGTETKLTTGWYVLSSDIAYPGRITVAGDVTLILGDDCTFDASNGGINVSSGNSLTVYAQSVTGSEHLGVLNAKATAEKYAGIGGGDRESGGSVTINGGNITAYGEYYAAGIGGGELGSGGSFTLNNGKVTASSRYYGAGIGGGYDSYGSDVIINGGILTATGGGYGAGIGGGGNRCGGSVTINGGTITANAGEQASGIGGGFDGTSGRITINGGNITVTGGDAGSGIGGGYTRGVDEITINGGTVNVTVPKNTGAAIGGGKRGAGGTITINGGKVSAASNEGAGIGGEADGDSCTVILGYSDDEDFIYASSYAGTVKITDGKAFTDGTHTYTDKTPSETLSALTDTTLTPAEFYDITVEESAYGTVTAPEKGAAGSTITLTVEPDKDCSVDTIKVNGTEIEPEDGVYAFEMPYEAVTITAKFFGARVSVTYLDETGCEDTVMALPVSEYDEEWEDGWYAVTADVVNNHRISCEGNVHLILCDDTTFDNSLGVTVSCYQSLQVYGQSKGNGTWNIEDPESGNAGIGGLHAECGDITINGGVINVTGGQYAAGIGSGISFDGLNGDIIINGGTINAESGEEGVAIGCSTYVMESVYGTVTINGGNITATGGETGAGIGGAFSVTVAGGNVTATGSEYAAGIGGDKVSVTLTYTDDVSITSDSYSGSVTLEKPFNDGTAFYPAGTVNPNDIAGKTLVPYDGMTVRLAGYTLSLDGDIGVNFYMELSDEIAQSETAYMQFTIPTGDKTETQTVLVSEAVKNGGYYAFKCNVAAKEMTSQIKAQMFDPDNGNAGTVYTYSVKEYADYLLAHTDDRYQYKKAAPLVKAMLNYGAAAQVYFDKTATGLANADLSVEDQTLGTITDQLDAWKDVSGEDLSGITFDGTTLSLKSQTTLSLYFTGGENGLTFTCTEKPAEGQPVKEMTVETVRTGTGYIARIRNIAASDLQKDYVVTVSNDHGTVTYNPMTYCYKALHGGTQNENLQNVVRALYWYSEAANDYFYENVVDLGALTGNYEAQDGDVLTGTLTGVTAQYQENKRITIADGATVTLRNADITCLENDNIWDNFAGITPLGDATVILEGTNKVKGGYEDYPAIIVPVNHTLTIDGDGSLEASTNGVGSCAIGGKYLEDCGSIVIKGGTITAYAGINCAAIGSSCSGVCGDITISGGTVTAYGGHSGAGIGSGVGSRATCGTITISGGTVTAEGGTNAAGIGCGEGAHCPEIIISGGDVIACGGYSAAGIGSGYKSDYGSECGDITISGGTVYAEGGDFGAGIGSGAGSEENCGTITITGGEVEARGGYEGAGIGSGEGANCTEIIISGGTVYAEGGNYAAGIGGGGQEGDIGATCGDITITAGVTQVTAKKGRSEEWIDSIGRGYEGSCGTVTIEPGANVITN